MLAALVRHCIERRVAAVGVTIVFAVYGLHAYWNTPVEAFPDVTNLQVNVIAQSAGLAPPEIERQLTIPLERSLNGTPGMIGMRSESLFGLSLIYLTFEDGADSFRARALVGERLASADLPDGVTAELGPDATPLGQIFQYHLVSDRHDLAQLRAEQEWLVAPMLRRIPGVADVVTRGGFLREVHVEIDPARLQAHGLTVAEVSEAVERASRNVGGGFLTRGDQQLVVRGVGLYAEPADIGRAVLASEGGTPVTVADVARLLLSHTPRQGSVGYNLDHEVVEGVVYLRRGENPSRVLEQVHEKIESLGDGILPEGMAIRVFYDRSNLVSLTLRTVHTNLAEGALLVIGLVWLFIRSLRGALIVGVVIPLSLLSAFIGLYSIGLPANLISMGAIDFGIIVDGAVVVVENVIHKLRHSEARTKREHFRLVLDSAVAVARPTFYAMAIIIAALIPVFALERVEGRIFRPLALTYTFALLGALAFSLTVVPALCAIFLRKREAGGADPAFVESLRGAYVSVLRLMLARRAVPIVAALLLLGSAAVAATRLGTEFLPDLDEGDMLVFVEMPTSSSLEAAQAVLHETRRRVLEFPEVLSVETQQGRPEDGTDNESVNMAEMPVRLRARDQWRRGWDKDRLTEAVRVSLSEIPGVRFNFSQPMKDNVEEAMSGVRGKVVLKIFGHDLEVMRQTLLDALGVIEGIDGVIDLSLYRDRSVPQLEARVDRPALARAGIDVASTLDVVETALAGKVVSEVWRGERVVPVRVRVARGDPQDPASIGEIRISGNGGDSVPLRELVRFETSPGRASINRESNSRAMALKFNVEGRDLGSVIREARAAVGAKIEAPEGHYLVWTGEFENQQRAMARLRIIVPISLLVVFALLYGALGSGRSALAILLIAPFALTGGIFGLLVSDTHLSVSAAIGFIALLGQVSLAGLLMLGAVEDHRRDGMALLDALVRGARERFRAVLLAALLAMLALLPMALSSGVGSETQKPFAVVLIGGMVTTLLVSLLVLPIVYTWVGPARVRARGEEDLDA